MPSRSRLFRNGDEGRRSLWRAARAGDPQAVARYGMELRRAGEALDPQLVEAMRWLPEDRATVLLGAWGIADGAGRVRLYSGMATADVRYPEAAFLSALSGPEREMCSVVSWMRGKNVVRGDASLSDMKIAGSRPHTIELVSPDSDDPESSQAAHRGVEGLERARERAAVVERDWAPLVRTTTPHTVGDGFYEVVLFLTPSGYAVSDRLYSANEHHRGVVSWRYDVTERHLPGPDALESGIFGVTPCLRTIGEIHALETRIQLLLETTGRELGGMHASWHVPGWVTAQAINGWNATPGELVWRNAPCLDMGGVGHCLAVIPASDGPGVTLPFVTIGVSPTSSATGRTRRVLPGHFWPELMPWRPGRALDRRLTEWAARQAPDRVRVQGDLALVWARWNDWLHERFVALRPLDTLDQVAAFVSVPIMPQDDEA